MSVVFRRDFYHLIKEALEQNTVSVLLGPRKCGKTVCLKQIDEELEYSHYFDFKTLDADATLTVFDDILLAIQHNEEKVYLLDGITYVRNIEIELCKMAHSLTDDKNAKTRVVLTGSQSFALETWVNRAFGGDASKIRADFISYPEFLRYKGFQERSAEMYAQFLVEASVFHQITSLEDYLNGCLEETVVANSNTSDYILGNEIYLLEDNLDLFLPICRQVFCNKETIAYDNEIKHTDVAMAKQTFQFLKNCDLINMTPAGCFRTKHPLFYRLLTDKKELGNCETNSKS